MSDSAPHRPLPAALSRLLGAARERHPSQPWRCLDELAETPEFRRWLEAEFPAAAEIPTGLDRRRFLQVMGASFALAGVSACTQSLPTEEIVPYVHQPEEVVPGRPTYYATTLTRDGWGHGAVVESHTGRPTKVEGNPDHPASRGATSIFAQAAVLSLYDPDRSQAVANRDGVDSWDAFHAALAPRLAGLRQNGGRGLRLLTGNLTSPTLVAELRRLLEELPQARWHRHQPADTGRARAGRKLAYGRPLEPVLHADRADVVVALDADPFLDPAAAVRFARDFADRRRARAGELDAGRMNRLYVAEPSPTLTGAKADNRLRVARGRIGAVLTAIARAVGLEPPGGEPALAEAERRWAEAAAAALLAQRGRGLLLVGEPQSAALHALAHLVNAELGNLGTALELIEPPAGELEERVGSVAELAAAMTAGEVTDLVMIDVNPVYDAPADLAFGAALQRVGFSVHHGLFHDETAAACDWHLPLAHELESWGDARAFDGTASLVQPLIAPMYQGRSALELVAGLAGDPLATGHELVRRHWDLDDDGWRRALHRGVIEATAAPVVAATPRPQAVLAALADLPAPTAPAADELVLAMDDTIWDGRHANNAWLQELPKPQSMLTWDNAALLSPARAAALGVGNGDLLRLGIGERQLEAPVWIQPGQADHSVTLAVGYGRRRAGRVGDGRGVDAYHLRSQSDPWGSSGLQLTATGGHRDLATTQHHNVMEGRDLLRWGTVAEFASAPAALAARPEDPRGDPREQPSLYPGWKYTGQQWGMSVDLTACIGCGVCTIACQAENNIPVVGSEQVRRGREMHWIRIDRYFTGTPDEPVLHHQPVPCMHCEQAPCEVVCPVGATQHSHDGLNEMIYNRCVGTRYCSNNCPYKVRRFNFLRFTNNRVEVLKMQHNPDVTVRGRGVMEKCTYCVQRIREAEITARKEDRPIRDGEIVTACQAACPTRAIEFGDVADPATAVSRLKAQPHDYHLLGELNTRPRTSYLAAVRNPDPSLPAPEHGGPGEAGGELAELEADQ